MNKHELTTILNTSMSYLTDEERAVFILTYYENLNIAEVLAVLNITEFDYQKLIINVKSKIRAFTDILDKIDNSR